MRILVIDIGGNNIKVRGPGRRTTIKIPSGPKLTAARMAKAVLNAAQDWTYDAVSIGYPGPVVDGHPAQEPHNLGGGWVRFDYQHAFKRPVRIINDAAMQALGSYQGGRMLYLGLGTGLGSALVVDGVLVPTELAHLPYRKGATYEDYVGQRGYARFGRHRWSVHVAHVVELLRKALLVDYVVLGGGNAKRLDALPPGVVPGSNANAFAGGVRLWDDEKPRRAAAGRRRARVAAHAKRRGAAVRRKARRPAAQKLGKRL